MAALVTLVIAKAHLRIETAVTTEDADITRKMTSASDIVVSYLKGRRIVLSEMTNAAGVATITTAAAHGLTSGDTVTVFGADDPEYNGVFTVTVTTSTAFTIPITGTPTSPATGAIGLTAVPTWTDATVPARVQAAVLLVLEHLWVNRGGADMAVDEALWDAIGRLLARDRDPALA